MSLINEALKKAQHQRSSDPADQPPMPGSSGGTHPGRQGKTVPAPPLLWIVAGSAAAVVVAVLLTLAIVTRKSPPPSPVAPALVAAPAPAVPAPVTAEASPVIAAPVITVPIVKVATAAQPPPAAEPAAAAVAVTPAPVAGATPPPQAGSGVQDIRILTYIDALRVAGIRSSGNESKVLMNDRVYRVNDTVDYALRLKLTRVAADGLTFTDAAGTTYVKNF